MRIGVHLSLGDQPKRSLSAAWEAGARCLQIFCSSPGAWKPPVLKDRKVAELAEARRELAMDPMVIHAIYLINLASQDAGLVRRSRASLVATLEAGHQVGALAVITHLGSHAGRGYAEVADQVAGCLADVARSASGDVLLAIENSAGQGGILGADIAELADLIDRAGGHPRLRIVLDTAHLCAAGWDFREPDGVERLVDTIGGLGLRECLVALHANDSKAPVGSRRDRHACIGDGHIGNAGFRNVAAQPLFQNLPWILETPDLDTRLPDSERFVSLRRLQDLLAATSAAPAPLP